MLSTWGVQQIPSASLDLNFLLSGTTLDSRVTFTRGTIGNYFGSNGLLQTATIHTPRFDYGTSGSTTLKGLLIEQASTNIALWCRDMTNAAWVKVNTTAALDQVGIDGAANAASSLTATLANATTLQTIVHVASTDTYSVSIKRITGTGEIDISTDGLTWTPVIINATNYTRFSVTQASVLNPAIGVRIVTNGDKIAVDYNQSEVLGFATSPIFTTTAGVARNADLATITATAMGFGSIQGTFFAQFQKFGTNFNSTVIGGSSNINFLGNASGNFLMAFDNTNFNTVGGVGSFSLTKGAMSYASTVQFLAGNGILSIQKVWSDPIETIFGLGSNNNGSGVYTNGWLQQVKYWPSRLSNGQLQVLTS